MGLDCIPARYPCVKAGTEERVDGKIDCEATKNCGGCPWKTRYENDPPKLGREGQILGMFGADCWYRGKSGTYMLKRTRLWLQSRAAVPEYGPTVVPEAVEYGFYGDQCDAEPEPDDGSEPVSGTPEHCLELADWMSDNTEAYLAATATEAKQQSWDMDLEEEAKYWSYAEWWLRFVAEEAEGFHAWY